MMILALDTSSLAASCALWRDGALLGEYFINAGLTHSQTIMPMTEALLRETGTSLAQVDRFGVSIGPGSFTGLRIGLSAVKGMAMALDKPCAAVSTLEGLAWNLLGFTGIIAPVMDARCMQVYTALFRGDGQTLTRVEPDMALSIPELGRRLAALGEPVTLVGDGAALCMEKLAPEPGPELRLCPQALRHQRASSVALLSARTETLLPPGALSPAYLRLPQAERELMKKKEETKA